MPNKNDRDADFSEPRRSSKSSDIRQERSAQGILGPTTFRRYDYAPGLDRAGGRAQGDAPGAYRSEGMRATAQLAAGATPSDVVRTNIGFNDRDIELPKETTKKPIAKPRSLAGGKR